MTDDGLLPAKDLGETPNLSSEADDYDSLPETLYELCSVNVRGWDNDDEEEARSFAGSVMGLAKTFSRYLDLSNLQSIVIGYDYREALASVTGADPKKNAPTTNEYGEGAAMAMTVMRDDEPWKVVVMWTPLVRQIVDEGHEHHKLALHTFWHELVHVDDTRVFATTFPGGWRAAFGRDELENRLLEMVNPCQSEYSAARKSAFWVPDYGSNYLDMLESALKDVDSQIRRARIAYRMHGDMDVLWPIVTERVRFLFQALGYALGHVDGVAASSNPNEELLARFEAHLDKIGELPSGWIVKEARAASRKLFDTHPWPGIEVFSDLNEIALKLIQQFRLYPRNQGEGLYIDAPYTSILDL
jgi:hypothetical protein